MEAQKKLRVARAGEQQEQRQRGRLNVSVKDVFGDAVTSEQTEEADFVDEDVLDPSKKLQNWSNIDLECLQNVSHHCTIT